METKYWLVVPVDVDMNECENPYPILDKRFEAVAFPSYDEAYEHSERLFDRGAVDTLVVPFKMASNER